MTLQEIKDRLEGISNELDNLADLLEDEKEEVNVDEVEAKVEELKEEKRSLVEMQESIIKEQEKRSALLNDIAEGRKGNVVTGNKEIKEEMKKMEFRTKDEAIRSEVYESAFAKRYTMENPDYTEDEKRALNTTNGATLIPHQWVDTIVDQIKETHPLLEDLTWNQINAIVEIPRRLSITSGDAAVVEEGQCAPGEENEFDSIQVDLKEIKKMLEISSKMGQLTPSAFKNWLIAEVRDRIGTEIAKQTIAAIKADILEENKVEGEASLANILSVFGLADGSGTPKVYANRKTLYGSIYAIAGAQGQNAFVANPVDALKGNLLGTELRVDSAMADNEVLVVFPQEVFFNVPGGIRVKSLEDDCFNIKISGVALTGAKLKYRKGAALLTVTSEPAV